MLDELKNDRDGVDAGVKTYERLYNLHGQLLRKRRGK